MKAQLGAVFALALLLSGRASVSGAAEPAPHAGSASALPAELTELEDVLVSGARRVRDPEILIEWLRRLVGQFRYTGYVDLRDRRGAPLGSRPVKGGADCVAFGMAPGVRCSINVSWPEVRGDREEGIPGGVSSLNPALVIYGLDPDNFAIHYLQVDNKGMADSGHGYLRGNTLTTTMPCVGVPGKCERVAQITAQPDGGIVQMQVDINQDDVQLVRYQFLLRKIAGDVTPPSP